MPTVRIPLVGKTCSKCKTWKDSSLFGRRIGVPNGLQAHCKQCKAEYRVANRERICATQKKYRELNKEKIVAGIKDWESRNKDKVRARGRKYDSTHREVRRQQFKDRVARNPELHKAKVKAYINRDKEKWAAIFRHHAAMRKKAIRSQKISLAFKKEISEIYKKAPTGFHVDHIVPLKGNGVCGLHVPWNLQYLSATENHKKGNRYADS